MEIAGDFTDPLTIEQCGHIEDIELCKFYYKALKRLLDVENTANVSYLHRYFKIFCEYYDSWCQLKSNIQDPDINIIKLLSDSFYYRFAFVYRNAILLSSAVAFHFRNICKKSSKNIKSLMAKKLVKICSFGGCSASDIVAIVTVLESIASENGIELDFRVTIIESDERWKATCIAILSCLKPFHNASWKIAFIRGNLSKKNAWTTETLKAIQEADILTMIRFLSKFNHKKKIMQMISCKLQPQALLFVLDSPLTEIVEFSFGITDSDDYELIHRKLCDFHMLDMEAMKYLKKLYYKQFGDLMHFRSNTSFNVFISVWIKASPKSVMKCKGNI